MYLDYVCGKTRTRHSIWYSTRSKIAFLVLPKAVIVFSHFNTQPQDISACGIDLHSSYMGISTEEGVLHRDKALWYLDGNPCVPRLIMSMFSPDVIPMSEWNSSLIKCGKFNGSLVCYNPVNGSFWVKYEGTFYRRLILHGNCEGVEDTGDIPNLSSYIYTSTGVIGVERAQLGRFRNVMNVTSHLPVVLKRYAEKGM